MHTPAQALAWQLWRKNRKELITMAVLFLAFALIYPRLCAGVGFHPGAHDALDEMARKMAPAMDAVPRFHGVVWMLYLMFVSFGPALLMIVTLIYVVYMFTFTEVDQKTRLPMEFPVRVFTLPISTAYLYGWLVLGGMASVSVLYACWSYFVTVPHFEIYWTYQNWFAWMTILVTAQAIAWSLASWPHLRMVVLAVIFLGVMVSPAWREGFQLLLPPLFFMGLIFAGLGLKKMRCSQWQQWNWQALVPTLAGRAKLWGPARFASPAQAQLWFEWRQFARMLCGLVALSTLVPVIGHLLWRWIGRTGPIQLSTLLGFTVFLLADPLIFHACFGMSPGRKDMSFLLVRPITDGQIVSAMWKASAISTVLSWIVVLLALSALPLLGDFRSIVESQYDFPFSKTAYVLGLVFLTWRFAVVDLCFVLTGSRKTGFLPALIVFGGAFVMIAISLWQKNGLYWHTFMRMLNILLLSLVVLKFALAIVSFRVALQRRLLAPSTIAGYLVVWLLLVAGLLVLFHSAKPAIFSISLAIILVVPLARMGFAPIAVAWNRHS